MERTLSVIGRAEVREEAYFIDFGSRCGFGFIPTWEAVKMGNIGSIVLSSIICYGERFGFEEVVEVP
jgi:hypothetical protein